MKPKKIMLAEIGMQELSPEESIENNGGAIWILAILGYVGMKCVDDWQCFKDGIAGRRSNHNDSHNK